MDTPAFASRLALGLATAVSLLLGSPLPAAQPVKDDAAMLARIDALARQEADAKLLSGIILIARGDQILLQRAYGFENWESLAASSPATRFGIGSITKAMTETLVGLLVSQGRLDLNAPVSKYLGPFPNGPKGGAVTVRQLLEHRSGVPHRVTTADEETHSLHPADIVERVRATKLLFEPGTDELYSSAGFTCLARIIEVIEHKPFDAVLRDRIFQPASMMSATDETGQALMTHRAMAYRLGNSGQALAVFSAPYQNLSFLAGAGSVYATAEDLLHFVRALGRGTFGVAGRDQVKVDPGATWRSWYGRTTGYEGSVDVNPAADVTFVFLSNLRSASNWQLRERIQNVLLGQVAAAIPHPPDVAPGFETADSFIGAYGDPTDPIVITTIDGHLFRDDSEFYPIANGRYYLPASSFVMRFRRTSDGRVDAMITVRPGGKESVALRVPGHR